jgi:hypothetical protein
MSLLYRYHLLQANQPVVSLGGRWVRPCPIIPVSVIGPANTRALNALLDTGADDTVFTESLAVSLGVDLTGAPTGQARGADGSLIPLRYAQVTLRLASGSERREWPAWVGFTPAPLSRALLGFAGCLQFFDATFRGAREEVELTVNSLYPGT